MLRSEGWTWIYVLKKDFLCFGKNKISLQNPGTNVRIKSKVSSSDG